MTGPFLVRRAAPAPIGDPDAWGRKKFSALWGWSALRRGASAPTVHGRWPFSDACRSGTRMPDGGVPLDGRRGIRTNERLGGIAA